MEPQQILDNIKDHAKRGMFKYCGYELTKNEAETIVKALAFYIEYKEGQHGENDKAGSSD